MPSAASCWWPPRAARIRSTARCSSSSATRASTRSTSSRRSGTTRPVSRSPTTGDIRRVRPLAVRSSTIGSTSSHRSSGRQRTATAIVNTGQPQFYSALEGSFPRTYMRRAWFARVDFQVNQQQKLFWRYVTDLEHIECETCGGFNAAYVGANVWSPRDSNLVAHTWVIGSRMLNELRVQMPPSHLDNRNAPPGYRAGIRTRKGEFPPERFAQIYARDLPVPEPALGLEHLSHELDRPDQEYRDDFSWTMGTHSLKFGGALRAPALTGRAGRQPRHLGLRPRPVLRRQPGGDGEADGARFNSRRRFRRCRGTCENHWIQGYVADQWRVRSNVTVDLGLRYDNQYQLVQQPHHPRRCGNA